MGWITALGLLTLDEFGFGAAADVTADETMIQALASRTFRHRSPLAAKDPVLMLAANPSKENRREKTRSVPPIRFTASLLKVNLLWAPTCWPNDMRNFDGKTTLVD